MGIDWPDVLVHAVIGVIIGAVAAILPWTDLMRLVVEALIAWGVPFPYWRWVGLYLLAGDIYLLIENVIFWHVREAIQRWRAKEPYENVWTDTQVLLEWVCPSFAAPLAFFIIRAMI